MSYILGRIFFFCINFLLKIQCTFISEIFGTPISSLLLLMWVLIQNFSENNLLPLSKHRLFVQDILYFEHDVVVKLCYESLSASVMLTIRYLWHYQLRIVVCCSFGESPCSKICELH